MHSETRGRPLPLLILSFIHSPEYVLKMKGSSLSYRVC